MIIYSPTFSGSAILTGSLKISGSLSVKNTILGTSSYANKALTASYALSYSGTSGTSGNNGTSGSSGQSGTSGSSGSSGTSGSSGSSGTSGSSGSSGTSGSSGSSGTSGSSGSSGSSGVNGTLSLTGSTNNGVVTYNGFGNSATVETNLVFDGTNLNLIGNLSVSGTSTLLSASYVYITSSKVVIGDNIITLNANSPFKRFAGIEMYDSGSTAKSSILWDSLGNFFFISGSTTTNSQNKLIQGPTNNADLTTNYLPKSTAGNTLGNSILFDNGTNIGIGTNNPTAKLHIQGNISGSQFTSSRRNAVGFSGTASYARKALTASYALNASGGGSGTVTGSANYIAKFTSATAVGNSVIYENSNNIGIGTTSPSNILDIVRNQNAGTIGFLRNNNTGTSQYIEFNLVNQANSSELRLGTSYNFSATEWNQSWIYALGRNLALKSDNAIRFYTGGATDAYERMRIDSIGNIGIGTTSATYKLDINNGSSQLALRLNGSSADGPVIRFENTGTSGRIYHVGSTLPISGAGGGFSIYDVTGTTSRLLIDANGNVGVGTTSPSVKLHVQGSNNRIVAGAYNTNAFVISGSSVGIGTSRPYAKLHIQGNISGSQFTSSRRNAVGFSGTASYARKALTASYALNASGGGSTLRTGSTYPFTSSWSTKTTAIANSLTNRIPKYTATSTLGGTMSPIFESGSAFVGIGPISSSLVARLQVYRSGSNASVFKVDGGSGTLFEVTDNLSGSLFNVNTIAGLPIFEVFSNNRIVAGAYNTNAFVVSGSSVGIGTSRPYAKLHIQGNVTGSQFTSSRRNAVGFSGTASYARKALTASYALNASGGGGSGTVTGSTNYIAKFTSATAVGNSVIYESSNNIGIGTTSPSVKLHVQGSISGSQFTSSRRNAVGFSGTASYARKTLTASYALNASGGGGGGSVSNSITNRIPKYTATSTLGGTMSPIFESGSAFVGIGPISSSLVARLQVYRSGSNASVFKVDGGSGTLFEVTDNLSGSLFNVNDISGLPIFEVFSNNRIVAGAYNTNAFVISGSSVGIGTSRPYTKLHVQGSISGSQFTSSRRNAVGFSGTASYARKALTSSYSQKALTASYALNASAVEVEVPFLIA